MNKLLILDKSVFQGTARSELVRFVKCHRVILPHALCVECATSQKGNPPKDSKDPKRLVQKLLDVVKSGAYAGDIGMNRSFSTPSKKAIQRTRLRRGAVRQAVIRKPYKGMLSEIIDFSISVNPIHNPSILLKGRC